MMTAPTLSTKPLLFSDGNLDRYHLGRDHPMGPDRVSLALRLADHFSVLPLFDVTAPPESAGQVLERVHSPDYISAARQGLPNAVFGLGTQDNPVSPELAVVADRVVAATVAAAQSVWEGKRQRAVNLSGGLHHATATTMSGFCMFNDAAVAIKWLQDHGASRIAYLDFDAHHGDGVEQIFWDDPNVLTISVHESGLYLFPGTGHAHDIGGSGAQGTAINIALSKNAADEEWLQSTHAIIPLVLEKFRPQVLLTQHGSDPHRADPLADLEISIDALSLTYRSLAAWADKFCAGKWVALGGGGYHKDSVARAWTQLLAAVAGVELDRHAPLPTDWARAVGMQVQPHLGDDAVDENIYSYQPFRHLFERPCPALVATSRTIFPYWGLQPYA